MNYSHFSSCPRKPTSFLRFTGIDCNRSSYQFIILRIMDAIHSYFLSVNITKRQLKFTFISMLKILLTLQLLPHCIDGNTQARLLHRVPAVIRRKLCWKQLMMRGIVRISFPLRTNPNSQSVFHASTN